ncbi:MAG: sulfite exporter TauE/SafE family protein [Clostridia bacterium]
MNYLKNILWGIPIGFANGFFGSGGGVLAVLVLKKFLNTDSKKAHATAISIILPLCVASLFVYTSKGDMKWQHVLLCSLGGCVGAFTGAKLMGKISDKWLKVIFGAVMIFSGVRMII